jgi:TonB family protein
MFARKTIEPELEGQLDALPSRTPPGRRQRQLMVGSLVLLVAALAMLLYNDRDFWFPDAQEAIADDSFPTTASASSMPTAPGTAGDTAHAAKKRSSSKPQVKDAAPAIADPPPVTAVRTVLPPLQVEVVAGNVHNTLRPNTNSVHVDLQPGSPPQALADPPLVSGTADTAAGVTSNAAENVQMSAGTSAVVSHSVTPGYPLLARQMKVQGSVILQALINKDGSIEDLHILSGPPILASAAREAVRQWRFKPHYQGADAVETLAKITVNFTISTN